VSTAGVLVHNTYPGNAPNSVLARGTKAREVLAGNLGKHSFPVDAQAHHIFGVELFDTQLGKKLQDTLIGHDSGLQVGIDQHDASDIRDRQIFGQLEIINQNMKEAQRALVAPFRRSNTTSKPALWSDLRKLIFGLLEGGDLTTFGITKQNGKTPIFSKVTDVIQDPLETWEVGPAIADLSDVKQINWMNIDKAPELLDIHATHLKQRREDLDQALNQLVEIDNELRVLEGEAS
jgi:hypothetical protein